jgi:hypothetical protein
LEKIFQKEALPVSLSSDDNITSDFVFKLGKSKAYADSNVEFLIKFLHFKRIKFVLKLSHGIL